MQQEQSLNLKHYVVPSRAVKQRQSSTRGGKSVWKPRRRQGRELVIVPTRDQFPPHQSDAPPLVLASMEKDMCARTSIKHVVSAALISHQVDAQTRARRRTRGYDPTSLAFSRHCKRGAGAKLPSARRRRPRVHVSLDLEAQREDHLQSDPCHLEMDLEPPKRPALSYFRSPDKRGYMYEPRRHMRPWRIPHQRKLPGEELLQKSE